MSTFGLDSAGENVDPIRFDGMAPLGFEVLPTFSFY